MDNSPVIFKCRIGSHLYGTNRPESDEDFSGIKLHSVDQFLGLKQLPEESNEGIKLSSGPRNESGDIDCKFYYLQRFISLAGQGQPGQLEMLFAPEEMIITKSYQWEMIQNNIDLFKSRKGISPFIGFALAQAHKAVIKGENLNLIEQLVAMIKSRSSNNSTTPIQDLIISENEDTYELSGSIVVKKVLSDDGTKVLSIAGRKFNTGLALKRFLHTLESMEERYGSRVRKAAEEKYDYKSLGHAVRLLSQAEEFLLTGKITLPRPDNLFIKTILTGTCDPNIDWLDHISNKIDFLKQVVEPGSRLPAQPDWDALNNLCLSIHKDHISSEFKF